MTAEEQATVFGLLLSDGIFENKTAWYGEKDGMLAFCNGGDCARVFTADTAAARMRLVYGEAEGTVSEGVLRVEIPPGTPAVFAPADEAVSGVEKGGILYKTPKNGGVIRCESDAWAAQYRIYNGKPELIRLYSNGDTVWDGAGEMRFFRWNNMQPR